VNGFPYWTDIWYRAGWRVQERDGSCRLLDPRNRTAYEGSRAECVGVGRGLAPRGKPHRAVIVLHGLAHYRNWVTRRLSRALAEAGWVVADVGYASLTRPFDAHARAVRRIKDALVEDGADPVSVVGHSLGGLVARAAMAGDWPEGSRLVQLGTPNSGSRFAELLSGLWIYRKIFGPGGQIVRPAAARSIPLPSVPTLVIAGGNGRRGWNPLLGGDNDGTVAVAEARLDIDGAEFLRVKSLHTFLPSDPAAIAATVAFLARR
jgi:pimeloyl-ACP methyl ester carboxylesterase